MRSKGSTIATNPSASKKSHTIQRCFHHSLLHLHNLTRALGCDSGGSRGPRRKIGKLMKIDEICRRSLWIYVSKWWSNFQNNWLNFVNQVFFRKVSSAKVVSWVKLSMDLEQTNITSLRQNCHAQCTSSKVKIRGYVSIGVWLTRFQATNSEAQPKKTPEFVSKPPLRHVFSHAIRSLLRYVHIFSFQTGEPIRWAS